MMSTQVIYSSMVVWFAMVTALVGGAVFAGVRVTLATCAVALAVGLMPPAMMLSLRVPAEGRRVRTSHSATPDSSGWPERLLTRI